MIEDTAVESLLPGMVPVQAIGKDHVEPQESVV